MMARPAGQYVLVLAAALALYMATCAPGPLWQDSGMFQYRVWHGDLRGGLGLALAHPLYILAGMAAGALPWGEYAWRVNLVSSITAAIAVANVFLLIRLWTGRIVPATVGALGLAVSWTFWQHACIAEVYTFYAMWLTVEWLVLTAYVRTDRVRWLIVLGLVNGLSIATHMWGAIPLACYGVFLLVACIRRRIRPTVIAGFAAAWMIGAAPYLWLIVERAAQTGDVAATLQSALFGDHWAGAVLNTRLSTRLMAENLLFMGYSFPTPNLILAAGGFAASLRRDAADGLGRWLAVLGLLFLAFAFRYTVPDRYAFFLPFYVICAVWMGIGTDRLLRSLGGLYPRTRQRIVVTGLIALGWLPMPIYAVGPTVARRMNVNLGVRRTIPFRDEYAYFLQPWQHGNDGPRRFATEALTNLPQDAIVLADGTTVYALWYVQAIDGLRPDVRIVSPHGDYHSPLPVPDAVTLDGWLDHPGVYVVSPVRGYCPSYLLNGSYAFEPTGTVFHITRRRPADTRAIDMDRLHTTIGGIG